MLCNLFVANSILKSMSTSLNVENEPMVVRSQRVSPFYHDLDLGLVGLVGSLFLSSKFSTQFLHPTMFQGHLWRLPRWCIYFFVYNFSSFHPNNFRKFDVDPIHRVSMFLPCFLQVPCKTWCFQVDCIRILVFLIHRIHRQKEYCLSFAQILIFLVLMLNWWWNVNWSHIQRDKCTWRNRPESRHCLVMKDQ